MDKITRVFKQGLCCLVVGMAGQSYASEFYTIIGPDGRPMIVQRGDDKKVKSSQKTAENNKRSAASESKQNIADAALKSTGQSTAQFVDPSLKHAQLKDAQLKDAQLKDAQPKSLPVKKAEFSKLESSTVESKQAVTNNRLTHPAKQVQLERFQPVKALEEKTEKNQQQHETTDSNAIQKKNVIPQENTKLKVVDSHQAKAESVKEPVSPMLNLEHKTAVAITPQLELDQSAQKQNTKQMITEIDGIEYVDNEYLEDREFNLEGKKRFYIMPDSNVGGPRRFETIEREKGITKSVFSKFVNKATEDTGPVVLASTYYRLPKVEVEQALEQACFTGKKIEKAKLLSLDKDEIGLWPVAPIKEKFVYDVLKLDSQVENIDLVSYASSQKSPSFYWPLVVFLDQHGCVLEGVSGFKNQDVEANNLHYSAMQGVLKKPPNAIYLFMTPLAEAVDVQNVTLSNKGQIKLTVLR